MAGQALEKEPKSNVAEFSVSELSSAIKRTLEDGFGYVRLRGEISGFRGPHSSGHCYFALKDDKAKIEAVVWRGVYSRLKVKPEEGMEVIAQGRITTYPNASKYQIVIEALEPAGIGALMALLEERKKKLAGEGLFDDARKRPLPFLPRVVGIVTSPTGAVIRDMMHGFKERFPAHVVLWPVRVQGEDAAGEIATAIRGFNALPPDGPIPRPEVLIVARGGGSLEDLWSFNEEIVVRAAGDSTIPLISAVGHETDWTLLDLVADARAPTPTKAAEWAVPMYSELVAQNEDLGTRLKGGARRLLETARTNLRAAARGLPRPGDLVALPRQRFDAVERRLSHGLIASNRVHAMALARSTARLRPGLLAAGILACRNRLERAQQAMRTGLGRISHHHQTNLIRVAGRLNPDNIRLRVDRGGEQVDAVATAMRRLLRQQFDTRRAALDANAKLLASLGYHSVLERGYAVVRDDQGRTVTNQGAVSPGMALEIELRDGRIDATAGAGSPDDVPPTRGGARPRAAKPGTVRARVKTGKSSGGGQGSLF